MSSWSYSAYSSATRCLRLYKHQFITKDKPDYESPDLAFGSALHSGINALLTKEDAQAVFQIYWTAYQDKPIAWGRYSWADLAKMGAEFLRKFEKLHAHKYALKMAEERLRGEYKGVTFDGTPDFIGSLSETPALMDFKTSGANYVADRAFTAVQLNLYAYLASQNGYGLPKILGYQVFNKYTGAVQNPLTWEFSEKKMYEVLDSVVAQCGIMDTGAEAKGYPQNFNECLAFNKRCAFWNHCHKN